jgi:hypothetical protein
MDDGSHDDLRDRLYGELSEAYDGFFTELVQATRIWGFWVGRRRIAGPFSSWGLLGSTKLCWWSSLPRV